MPLINLMVLCYARFSSLDCVDNITELNLGISNIFARRQSGVGTEKMVCCSRRDPSRCVPDEGDWSRLKIWALYYRLFLLSPFGEIVVDNVRIGNMPSREKEVDCCWK